MDKKVIAITAITVVAVLFILSFVKVTANGSKKSLLDMVTNK
jgi:hypothetical protein